MHQIQDLSKNGYKFVEPVAFVALAFLAGSARLIKYFPGYYIEFFLTSALLTRMPILLSNQNNKSIFIIAGIAMSTIFTPSIVKKLTETLGGTVNVESEIGKGTSLQLEFNVDE